ncbi:MAG: hypothetical protein WC373_02115 [Smithella sp.]|jgi:hypothetical protein
MITSNASSKIARFNATGYHYNFVVERIYVYRERCANPFGADYLPYIVAGLISFDIGRMMGEGTEQKYDISKDGFATKLFNMLQGVEGYIGHLADSSILDIAINKETASIKRAYNILSGKGKDGLHSNIEKSFHVGATKILHFMNPKLFIIIDSNAARAFRESHHVPFKNTTQPGYTADLYIECMRHVQQDIKDFGFDNFQNLEPDSPITRIYDKLTFATGSGW